jgi:hypothetical protein
MMQRTRRYAVVHGSLGALWLLFAGLPGLLQGQDYSVLRINEVISDNTTEGPAVGRALKHLDMVEIYNTGDVDLPLGTGSEAGSLALTAVNAPTSVDFWVFPAGVSNIPKKGFLVVFLGARPEGAQFCELYTSFALANDGSEPVSLWGPKPQGVGERPLIDRVWPPPLRQNVSFGRFPDGAGAAPASPLGAPDAAFNDFHFCPAGTTSFGTCAVCPTDFAVCSGAPNTAGGNLEPRVERFAHSTNHPAAGEAVEITLRVKDDKEPTPGNISRVYIKYSVNGQQQTDLDCVYQTDPGLQTGASQVPPQPLDRWAFWKGIIPGQAKDARVTFVAYVQDAEGLVGSDPGTLCPEGVGPCDRDFGGLYGGQGCTLDESDITCQNPEVKGKRYVECSVPLSYVVGYEPQGSLASLVINEVVARQDNVLKDLTQGDCTAKDACPDDFPDCCKFREDFIEIYNTSTTETVSLAGLWLSDKPFHPRGWRFPDGANVFPGEYLIVWLDNDGGKCPDPAQVNPPCFWECPDPTNPAAGEYHTNFALDADADQVYLFDVEATGFGVIHGVEFEHLLLNESLSLTPNGDRSGDGCVDTTPTPRAPNDAPPCGGDPRFLRGDANSDCRVDISDGVYTLGFLFMGGPEPRCKDAADSNDDGTLNITDPIYLLAHLFQGGPALPLPGMTTPGVDPTSDSLPLCDAVTCE